MSIQSIKEEQIRQKLTQEFGMKFTKRSVKLIGIDSNWKADAVSEDGTIVCEIKTAGYKEKPGTAIPRNLCNPYIFLKNTVNAKKRILIYTEKSLHDHVIKSREGQLVLQDGIEIRHMKL